METDDGESPIKVIDGVPVVTAPGEIDITTAGELRVALLRAAAHGHAAIVVDMTRTSFCDSAGLHVLVRAHERALAEGGELRLALPADGAVMRTWTLTGLHCLIPHFDSLDEALLPPTAATIPRQPRPGPGLRELPLQASSPETGTSGESVTPGDSGPVVMLSGDAEVASSAELSALLVRLLAGGTRRLTVDVSGLRSADSASVRSLALAAMTLRDRGGSLVLLRPREPLTTVLALTGLEHMFTIWRGTRAEPEPQGGATGRELTGPARRPGDGGYRREVSSATMSAAGCDFFASATLCPAHIESASIRKPASRAWSRRRWRSSVSTRWPRNDRLVNPRQLARRGTAGIGEDAARSDVRTHGTHGRTRCPPVGALGDARHARGRRGHRSQASANSSRLA